MKPQPLTGPRVTFVRTMIRGRNRLIGLDQYKEPLSYFGPGGVAEAAEQCAAANRDLLAFVRPPVRIEPTNVTPATRVPHKTFDVEAVVYDSPLPSGDAANDRVPLRIYRKRGAPPADRVVLFHHATYQRRFPLWEWLLAPLIEHVPVALMAAPYHFERTGADRFPGEGTMNPNPYCLFRSLRQWCHDRQAAVALLEGQLGLKIAAEMGYSLGGFQTLILAAAGRVDVPIVTLSSTNRYAWGLFHGVMAYNLKVGLRKLGIGYKRLHKMTRSIEAERHVHVLRDHPTLYVYSGHDHVDPNPSLDRLGAALEPTRTLLFPTAGHATVALRRQRIMAETVDFLRTCGTL